MLAHPPLRLKYYNFGIKNCLIQTTTKLWKKIVKDLARDYIIPWSLKS